MVEFNSVHYSQLEYFQPCYIYLLQLQAAGPEHLPHPAARAPAEAGLLHPHGGQVAPGLLSPGLPPHQAGLPVPPGPVDQGDGLLHPPDKGQRQPGRSGLRLARRGGGVPPGGGGVVH